MSEEESSKRYDLEERTHRFAQRVRALVKRLRRLDGNVIDGRQLLRSSGSIGANYIEANESLGRKDFIIHLRISRKEAKESRWWASLLDTDNGPALERERDALVQEATELMKIFAAIIRKSGPPS